MGSRSISRNALRYGRTIYSDGRIWDRDPTNGQSSYSRDVKPDRSRDRKPPGWKMPKPYVRSVETHTSCDGYYAYSDSNSRTEFWGNFRPGIIGTPRMSLQAWTPSLESRALTSAMLKIKDTKFELGVTLAEASRTASMVGQNATQIARAISNLRKGRFGAAAKSLGLKGFKPSRASKDLANRWLEYQYGWRPLLQDIDGACRYLAERSVTHPPVLTGKGFAREYSTIDRTIISPYANRYYASCEELAFVRLDFEPANSALIEAKHLNMLNPASVAWELVPFSFVLDWFVPVGDFLSCFDYAVGLDFKSGSLTRMFKEKGSFTALKSTDKSVDTWYLEKNRSRFMSLRRTVYGSAPFPPRPHSRLGLGFTRMANGLALLRQAFK